MTVDHATDEHVGKSYTRRVKGWGAKAKRVTYRLVKLTLSYHWDFEDGSWRSRVSGVRGLRVLKSGELSEHLTEPWTYEGFKDVIDDLLEKYRPTTTVVVEERNDA